MGKKKKINVQVNKCKSKVRMNARIKTSMLICIKTIVCLTSKLE